MAIWKSKSSPQELNERLSGSMANHVGIEITEVGEDFLKATMPVDQRTRQHRGLLHGGANVVLAETVGSIASVMCCEPGFTVVGLEINANHLRTVKPPHHVTGIAKPLHIGRRTMVWEIKIYDERGKLVCISRLTTAVVPVQNDSVQND